MSCVGIIFHVGIMAVTIHNMLRTRGRGFNSSVICSNLHKHCKYAYKNLDRYVQTTRFMWIWYNFYLTHRSNKHCATPIVKLLSMDEKCHGSSHWFAIKEPRFLPILNSLCNLYIFSNLNKNILYSISRYGNYKNNRLIIRTSDASEKRCKIRYKVIEVSDITT